MTELINRKNIGRYECVVTRRSDGTYSCAVSENGEAVMSDVGFSDADEAMKAATDHVRDLERPGAMSLGAASLRRRVRALLEDTASRSWESMSPDQRRAYLKAHPRSKYGRAVWTPSSLRAHLKSRGWVQKGAHWVHPDSRRKMVITHGGTHRHSVRVTHPNGDVTEKRTNSDRALWRHASKMARPPDNGGISRSLSAGRGSLHDCLGVPHGKPIPLGRLAKLADSDHPLAGRARLVLSLKRARKRGPVDYAPPSGGA